MSRTTPDQEWWTAAEIAAAALPDLPGTKRRVNATVERLGWQQHPTKARRRAGRGGGWEYHWSLFPSRAQAQLLAHSQPAETAAPIDRDMLWRTYETLPDSAKVKAQLCLARLQKVEALEAAGATRSNAVADVAQIEGCSPRAIWNWFGKIEGVRPEDRLPFLAPKHRTTPRQTRRTEVDPEFGRLIKADWLRPEQPSLTSVYDRAVRIAKVEGLPIVPLHTIRRWLDRTVSTPVRVMQRQGREALARLQPAQERDKTALHAMEAVNADFHRFDVFVRFPAGPNGERETIARPQLVAFQDLFSGRLLAWGIDRTPNSHAVQLCIGEMIERWGIPVHALFDNGREFAAKMLTGGSPTRHRFKIREEDIPGLLTTLDVQIHWAKPYSGQSKPIERAFRDLCDRVAKHPAFSGAYTGNRPDAKPENYGAAAVPLDTFLAVLADEIELHNTRGDRRSEVAYGRSFADVFDESYATAPIRKATAEQRRLWLMGAEGVRTHSRTGQINFMRNRYHDDWLVEHRGERVLIRFDRNALWDGLHVYSLSGGYLGFVPCIQKSGFFDLHDARSTEQRKKAWRKAVRAERDAQVDLAPAEIAGRLPSLAPDSDRPAEATVVRGVFNAPKPARPAAPTAEERAAHSALVTDMEARRAMPRQDDDDGRRTYARALELERQLASGDALTKDQHIWLEGYQRTAEYKGWKRMVELFRGGGPRRVGAAAGAAPPAGGGV